MQVVPTCVHKVLQTLFVFQKEKGKNIFIYMKTPLGDKNIFILLQQLSRQRVKRDRGERGGHLFRPVALVCKVTTGSRSTHELSKNETVTRSYF